MESFVNLFGPLDALAPHIEYIILGLVVVNLVTRHLAHRHHVAQYEEGGAEAVSRYPIHVASNVLLVLASFYYLTLHQHAGIVLTSLVVGLFVTDFFEFESRLVEARNDMGIERPKGAMVASVFVFLYAAFLSLFWVIAGPWGAVI